MHSLTDAEVMKIPFVECIHHYMEDALIESSTRIAVEVCIFVEDWMAIKDLDTMKVPQMEELLYNKYMSIVRSIPDG